MTREEKRIDASEKIFKTHFKTRHEQKKRAKILRRVNDDDVLTNFYILPIKGVRIENIFHS